jgi:serine/threonine protein kinase
VDDTRSTTSAASARTAVVMLSGRYRLGALLGSGGMADVYEAEDTLLKRAVAIKQFRPITFDSDNVARRQAEVRVLASLNHPGLVHLLDAGKDDTGPGAGGYLVMELVSGTTLRELVRRGPMPAADVAVLGYQVSTALAYVHAQGVIHRDIKPANILVTTANDAPADGVCAKLADFGVARMLDGTRITVLGMTVGTANYLSPEQAIAGEVGPASDIYSLGLVLLECLTGQVAYPGHGVEAAVARLHHGPIIPVSLGSDWTRLLAGMTASAAQRRPTAAAAASALENLLASTHGLQSQLTTLLAAATTDALGPLAGIAWDSHPSLANGHHQHHLRRSQLRPGWRTVVLGTIVAIFLSAVLLTVLAHARRPSSPTAPPTYVPVSGQLGTDLSRLQRSVQQ